MKSNPPNTGENDQDQWEKDFSELANEFDQEEWTWEFSSPPEQLIQDRKRANTRFTPTPASQKT